MDRPATDPRQDDAVLEALVAGHRRFLSFLERRLPSRDVAEDILQESFVKAAAKRDSLRDDESATAWFYRLLRNGLTDYYRHRDVAQRATERLAREKSEEEVSSEDLLDTVCQCIHELLPALKAEYAEAIRRVDLEGATVGDFAKEVGVTSGNARVRLHRARKALHGELLRSCSTCATHGCLDCTCGQPKNRPATV